MASTESFGAAITTGLWWNVMTSEVARSCRFEGTAVPGDLIDLFLDFAGLWATSRGQIHLVCVSY